MRRILLSTARSKNCDADFAGWPPPPQSLTGTAGLIRAFSPERCGSTVWEEDYDNPQNSLDHHCATHGWHFAGNGTERSGHRRLRTCGRRRLQQGFVTVEMGSGPQIARQQFRAAYVRFGSKADIAVRPINVRFTPKSRHWNSVVGCPLCANSGHWPLIRSRIVHSGIFIRVR